MKKKGIVFKRNKYLILFLAVFLGYVLYSVTSAEIKIQELKTKQIALQEELSRLTDEKESLSKQLEESKSLESIEKIAREKLKMVKPNELIYVIQEDAKKQTTKDSNSSAKSGK